MAIFKSRYLWTAGLLPQKSANTRELGEIWAACKSPIGEG
ncbi:Uncharacterized protein BC141101_02773 [Bacillus toyonensis]|nr:hypothetical protein bcere0017_31660 [Bacillus cereus Rock1-3]EEL39477.1 hypothetical protein bcere0020_31120 [Bacillus cereus Rock3-29]SCN17508.1 Uncharacterized protein BC141101_02773 [Bacillus toyonensis]